MHPFANVKGKSGSKFTFGTATIARTNCNLEVTVAFEGVLAMIHLRRVPSGKPGGGGGLICEFI